VKIAFPVIKNTLYEDVIMLREALEENLAKMLPDVETEFVQLNATAKVDFHTNYVKQMVNIWSSSWLLYYRVHFDFQLLRRRDHFLCMTYWWLTPPG
jgi:hypothetical protein